MGEIFVAKFETLHDTSILVRKKSFSKICIAKEKLLFRYVKAYSIVDDGKGSLIHRCTEIDGETKNKMIN